MPAHPYPPFMRDPNARVGGCFTCQHYGGPFGMAAWCLRDSMVRPMPEHGCCSWTREPGTDDEAYWERRESWYRSPFSPAARDVFPWSGR